MGQIVPPEDCGVYQNDNETITLPRILTPQDIRDCFEDSDVTSSKAQRAIMLLVWDYITELDSDQDFTNPVTYIFLCILEIDQFYLFFKFLFLCTKGGKCARLRRCDQRTYGFKYY